MKKDTPLSLFFLKHFLYLLLAIAAICLVGSIFLYCLITSDRIYSANYAERQAYAVQAVIEDAAIVRENMIPELCRYVVFDLNGNVKDGNITKLTQKFAWDAISGQKSDIFGNFYKVIQREGEYCVLQYKIIPQYQSETLRKILLPPQTLVTLSTLLLILTSIGICAVHSGRALKRKMDPLIRIAGKIQNQDLDFTAPRGDIKEINSILSAMDKMRGALRLSLEQQWKGEQNRRQQISALAHDLKTPLTIIRGNAELLYDTNPTTEQAESIGFIKESSLQMERYIKMLIELASETDLMHVRLQEVSLPEFVQEIQKTARGLCAPRKIHLDWAFRSEVQHFHGDAGLLHRAFSNVFSNAAENSSEGGTIAVEIFDEEGYLTVSVQDQGRGFSSQAIKYATTPFYMEDASRNSKSHFGIGLYFADMVIRLHAGQLILENVEEGGGAKVTMKIPIE